MSGGGGFDPGKDLANLDKDLGLSKNAPLIASAAATYFGVPLSPVEMGAILGTGRAIDKGSISEGINWGLQGYGGASIGAALPGAAAAPAAAATPAAAAIPVETAVPVPVTGAAPVAPVPVGGPDLVANAGASAAPGAVPAPTGVASLADMYGGPAASAPTPGLPGMFDKAAAAYSGLNPVAKYGIPLAAAAMYADRNKYGTPTQAPYDGPLNKLRYDPDRYQPLEVRPPTPYTPVYKDYRNMAGGGLTREDVLSQAIEGIFFNKPNQYATPPLSYDPARYDAEAGTKMVARPGMAGGGIADLGSYSDGGRMLKGPGDGMSDNIPATIAGKQPARLANEEFVVPADVVSHLGNGSSDAGAKQLYKMMDKVRAARTGKKSQAKQINPNKYMPA